MRLHNGMVRREDREWYRLAWVVASIASMWGSDKVRPLDLLPPNVAKRLTDP